MFYQRQDQYTPHLHPSKRSKNGEKHIGEIEYWPKTTITAPFWKKTHNISKNDLWSFHFQTWYALRLIFHFVVIHVIWIFIVPFCTIYRTMHSLNVSKVRWKKDCQQWKEWISFLAHDRKFSLRLGVIQTCLSISYPVAT